ncbi:MAG: hypothetical protein K8U57_35220 [Planctomycetes bacterium]|nr:hypothetical protein [Planctomycetota bacterium]
MSTTTHAPRRRRKAQHSPSPVEAEPTPVVVAASGSTLPTAAACPTGPTTTSQHAEHAAKKKTTTFVPLKKDGTPKKVLSWNDKLRILDPNANPERTEERLEAFANLFAFRYTDASITKARGGPRDWTALHGRVKLTHIARHLLADHAATLRPQWLATRSWKTSVYFAFDVDAHSVKGKRSFKRRCRRVEDTLGRVGINPDDPLQVLVQPTPSGGRHYYLFFDQPQPLYQFEGLWNDLGLTHVPGEIEFYPCERHALRLPFGHTPGIEHDPRAWIKFIDAYTSRRIKRFSFAALHEAGHRRMPTAAPTVVRKAHVRDRSAVSQASHTPTSCLGIPKAQRLSTQAAAVTAITTSPDARYLELIERGPKSRAEADELFALGIRVPGTRNTTLNILAQHLVWFRSLNASQAAEQLTVWAYDSRHRSKDIRHDLERGTTRVATDIASMCDWYEERCEPRPSGTAFRPHENTNPQFAMPEIEALRPSLALIPPDERLNQAHFLLSFLGFAKRHGQPDPDSNGWEAAPAVAAVIRRWPGCNHGRNKIRVERAVAAGLYVMTKEKYQAPAGRIGRARTYRLAVPVVAVEGWTLTYEAALKSLTENSNTVPEIPTMVPSVEVVKPDEVTKPETEEPCDASTLNPTDVEHNHNQPADLRTPRAGSCVGPGTPQRNLFQDAVRGVPGPVDGGIRAIRTDDLRTITDLPRQSDAGTSGRDHGNARPTAVNTSKSSTQEPADPQPTIMPELSFADRENAILGLDATDDDEYSRWIRPRREHAARR